MNKLIGALIVRLRRARGMSQEALAMEAGVDRRYLSDLENGKRNPSLDVLCRIAQCMELTLSQFFMLAEADSSAAPQDVMCQLGHEDAIVFQSPDYAAAFIGASNDGRAVYSYSGMVACLMANDGMTAEEAAEFIDYNTIRALDYMGPQAPIILYPHER